MTPVRYLKPKEVFTSLLFIFLFTVSSGAQTSLVETQSERPRKELRATKVTGTSPSVDGRLDDGIWKTAVFISDFLQKDPVEGGQPVEKTEVAIVFDDAAIYIGARMHSVHPENLRMFLDRRDNQGPTEQFIVSIDSYLDRRTCYGFGVNTSGVRFDRYTESDNEFDRDFSYNPVWEAKTSRDSSAWYAEIRIPFSQLRFNNIDKQTWGINFNRWVPERNEDVFWVFTPRNESGWTSRFGNLVGIEGVQPSRRLELTPYAASEGSKIDGDFGSDPFNDGSKITGRVGGDLKMGLGPNLTLDATFNPDFGQVEADPADVNLSAFETFFDERRPFFSEGNSVFNGGGFFYSRRIGASPRASLRGFEMPDYADQPRNSTILGAAKVSGVLKSGTSIGFLTAVTDNEFAKLYDSSSKITSRTKIEPRTFYGVFGLIQPFGKEQSTFSAKLTGVSRDLSGDGRLDTLLRKQAIAGAVSTHLRFNGGKYNIFTEAGFSDVRGSTSAITSAQLSPQRYFQRPDADYVEIDPNRNALSGYKGVFNFWKPSGKHWLYDVFIAAESPGLELNDAGQLGGADDIDLFWRLIYRETVVGNIFRYYDIRLASDANWNFGGDRQWSEIRIVSDVTWKNFWTSWARIARQLPGQDDTRTRGGPSMQNEAGWSFNAGFQNNFASSTSFWLDARYGIDELDGWLYTTTGHISGRLGTKWRLAFEPSYTREDQPRQFVEALSGGGAGTFGTTYVFSRLDRSRLRLRVRMNYFFSPDLSLEAYAEPYADGAKFYDLGELLQSRGHNLLHYNDGANFGFKYRSFRSNMVLRWEFSPGSTLFLVWQRNLEEETQEVTRHVRPGSAFDAFGADGEDFVALKLAYWIPIS
ncbi:MAG: DUF5916 domain-containing protein [candidate division Zixibacteria bacterium]|nr:DUF5916 domain-containing protein [candidate division Zixibacteria bacterium]